MHPSTRSPAARASLRAALLCLLLCSRPLIARAQEEADDTPMYEGTWAMHLPGHRAARLVVADWAGSWQETGPADRGADPKCRGRRFPITVQHSNPTEFEFTAWGSAVSPACPDITFSVKPVDAKTLAGLTGTGARITMTRATRR